MDKYKRFDKYFLYSYFNEINEKVGVFKESTPEIIIKEAENMFDIIDFEQLQKYKFSKKNR